MNGKRYLYGETVTITAEVKVLSDSDDQLIIEWPDGSMAFIREGVSISRLTPADGEPQPGELWEDDCGDQYMAVGNSESAMLAHNTGKSYPWREIHRVHGPLRKGWSLPDIDPAEAASETPAELAPVEDRTVRGWVNADGTRGFECECGTAYDYIPREELAEIKATHRCEADGLTRVSVIRNGQQTWAVHDSKRCVYLAVTKVVYGFSGVFSCVANPDGENDDCPWLGTCDGDAYVTSVARPIYDAALKSGWDETVIYGLLEELHAGETAEGGDPR